MKLRHSLFAFALGISTLSSNCILPSIALANPEEVATLKGESDVVKVVFLNGLPQSWWVPGVNRANQEAVDSVKHQCSTEGQNCAMWTWGTIKDVPKDLYDSGVKALSSFDKMVSRPMEIWTKECPATYADTVASSLKQAQEQTDSAQQRLTLLSGGALAYLRYAGKAAFQAPAVAFYHAASGLFAIPMRGTWIVAEIGGGAVGTVTQNLYNPIVTVLRYGQAVTCSGMAAAGVGIANLVLPQMPVPPASASLLTNEESKAPETTEEQAPTIMEVISGGEVH